MVLQALTNIGVQRAKNLVQQEATRAGDRNLAENMLVDLHHPFLDDLRDRLSLIPPAERDRANLVRLAREGCAVKPTLAIYLLGFLKPSDDLAGERAVLDLLRRQVTLDCHWGRFVAVRSLALRSGESIPFWEGLYRKERDGWQKAQLARIGFARFGRKFSATALDWLKTETTQYVQWELSHGVLESARGIVLRDYWDIWLPTTLQLRLLFPPRGDAQASADHSGTLSWLEAGHRPRDEVVRNHLLYGMARDVSGDATRHLLRVMSSLEAGKRPWWVLQPLGDRAALPLLRYWEGLETDAARRREAHDIVVRLESRDPGERLGREKACCQATRACLVSQVRASGADPGDTSIATPDQARAWLKGRGTGPADFEIRFVDSLERIADVSAPGTPPQRWEHLYGCWRDTRPRAPGTRSPSSTAGDSRR
ncbi:MAG: hypothetical protein ACREVG_09905 [Burkholderiales bacterium]